VQLCLTNIVLYDIVIALNSFNMLVILIFIVQKEGYGHEQFKNSCVARIGSCAVSSNRFAGLWPGSHERIRLLRGVSSRRVSSGRNGADSSSSTLGIQPRASDEVLGAWVNFEMQAACSLLRTNQLCALLRTGLCSALCTSN